MRHQSTLPQMRGGNAAQNNYLNHDQVIAKLTELAAAKDEIKKAAIIKKYAAISQANNDAGYKDLSTPSVMAGYQMAQDKAGLTALLTGPTNCAASFACQVEVNKNLNEILGVYDGYNSVNLLFNVVPAIMMSIALPAAGGAVMEGLGLGGVVEAGGATQIGYHATTPEAANAILNSGFRLGTNPGRLGTGGVYVNDTVDGAISEFGFHNPGITPTVLQVEYSQGVNASTLVSPVNYVETLPLNVDSITAPSLRLPSSFNTNVLNGSAVPVGKVP
jgi:hypothetical protein